ncbi:MAG: hypothetical protein ACKOUT_13960 [Novosphingobium sp.]
MKIGSFGKVAASLAAFTMVATPAVAAAGPQHMPRAASAAALPHDTAADRGGWGSNGWGNRWNGGWGRRHNDGIDGGDVLAGVLVLGTIAAIASAASKSSKDKREREEDARRSGDDSWRYGDDRRGDRPSDMGRGVSLDTAVDTCVADVERGTNRVDTVDNVNRQGDGWRVEGRTQGGASWNCSVDGSGRVKGVTTDDSRPRY